VDHICHRCQAPIEAGKPFCAQCGAPQIRVTVPETPPAAVSPHHDIPPLPSQVDWRSVLPKAIAMAVLSLVLAGIFAQLSPLLTLLFIGALGAVVVWWEARRSGPPAGTSVGMRIGLVTGFVVWVAHSALLMIGFLLFRSEVTNSLRDEIGRSAARSTPEARQMMDGILNNPDSIVMLILAGIALALFVFTVLGAIGGAIAAAALRSNQPR
jgi:hypothetical protein